MSSIFTKIVNGEIPCYKIAEDDESDYADSRDGILSAKLFRALEAYLVLEIMSVPVFRAIERFIKSEEENPILNPACINQIGVRMKEVQELFEETKRLLLSYYNSAVWSYGREDLSVLTMAWHFWKYPQGLPVGHPIFKTIKQFEVLFCKSEVAE
jgi:diadenosine tetraphosphate (Ap4A) HIT family hydrolase